MFSAGMLTALASSIALRRRGLPSGAPPPRRAAMVISLISFVNRRPRFASAAPFLCLIVAHLLCPDMPAIICAALENRPGAVVIERRRTRRCLLTWVCLWWPAFLVGTLLTRRISE